MRILSLISFIRKKNLIIVNSKVLFFVSSYKVRMLETLWKYLSILPVQVAENSGSTLDCDASRFSMGSSMSDDLTIGSSTPGKWSNTTWPLDPEVKVGQMFKRLWKLVHGTAKSRSSNWIKQLHQATGSSNWIKQLNQVTTAWTWSATWINQHLVYKY